jgi:23S rRNA (cytosine1962-C5)-methyltransferase
LNKIILKNSAERRLLSGHLWIFSNELIEVPKYERGEVVEVIFGKDSHGVAFYNPNSLISARLLLTDKPIDTDFFIKRINSAIERRKLFFKDEKNLRIVFGESDLLPGLIIDKYEDWIVMQINSYGMEIRKEMIKDALISIIPEIKGILIKANSKLREIEGLPDEDEIIFGSIPDEIFTEDKGIKLVINLNESQKTGYYLDQRLNRHFIRQFSENQNVLDCFCNQGGFGLNAAYSKAKYVTLVDSSANAINAAKKNFVLNNFENAEFHCADVFEELIEFKLNKQKWDVVILDPPAFAKNKKSIYNAKTAYSKMNKLGISVLAKNGFLVTSSCSQHISEAELYEIIVKEISKAGRKAILIHKAVQPPDHPILHSMPETDYLKFFVFQFIDRK